VNKTAKQTAPKSMQRETAGAGKCAKCGENKCVTVCACAGREKVAKKAPERE